METSKKGNQKIDPLRIEQQRSRATLGSLSEPRGDDSRRSVQLAIGHSRTFVVAVLVLRQTGGNLVEVIESIIDTMRQQSAYAQKLQAMTAEGRSSALILAMLPPAFAGLSYVADPGYAKRLYTDSMGQLLLLVAVAFYLTGVMWTRRLVAPKQAS